jgi:hypothetical protein
MQKLVDSVFNNNEQINKMFLDANNIINEESRQIDTDKLEEILGKETYIKLESWSETFGISLYDILTYIRDKNIFMTEEAEKAKETVINSTEALKDALSALYSGKDLSDDQIAELERLEDKYIELGEAYKACGRDAREYIEILGLVQEAEEQARTDALKTSIQETAGDFEEATKTLEEYKTN